MEGINTLFHLPYLSTTLLALGFMIPLGLPLAAQQTVQNSIDTQRDAMHKLSFLAGHWSRALSPSGADQEKCST